MTTADVLQLDLVDGRLRPAEVVLAGELDDPDTGASRGPHRASRPDAVEAALAAAAGAWDGGRGAWSGLPFAARAEALERFADELDARAEAIALADALDSGVPLAVTRLIAGSLGGIVRGALATAAEALAPE